MYIEELKNALAIDETYTLDNLKLLLGFELSGRKKNVNSFSSLWEMYENLSESWRFSTPRALVAGSPELEQHPHDVSDEYAMTAEDMSWGRLYYRPEDAEPRRPIVNDPEESVIRDFVSLSPKEKASAFYNTAYYLTVFSWLLGEHAEKDPMYYALAVFSDADPMLDVFENAYKLAAARTKKEKQRQIHNLKSFVRTCVQKLVESKELTMQQYEMLCLYMKLLLFVLMVEQGIDFETAKWSYEPESYTAYFLAEAYLRAEDDSSALTGLQFAFRSLRISDPAALQDAFNTMGILAINTGSFLQIAYDVYYSWLNRKMVGKVTGLADEPFGPEDEKWRRTVIGRRRTAAMRTNFAYVCSSIASTYEINSDRRKVFQAIAEEQIKKVLPPSPEQMDSFGFRRYGTYGYILLTQGISDSEKIQLGLKQLQLYYSGLEKYGRNKTADRLNVINNSAKAIMRILFLSYMKSNLSFDEWAQSKETADNWTNLQSEIFKVYSRNWPYVIPDDRNAYEYENAIREYKKLDKLLGFEKGYFSLDTHTINQISIILVLMRQTALNIQTLLRRVEYSSSNYFTRDDEKDDGIKEKRSGTAAIAYYTTLKNATYLFDLLYQESPVKAPRAQKSEPDSDCKNCLTVMNAKYMNDPHEGLTLLNELVRDMDHPLLFPEGSPKQFRESVYSDAFIFLKSFTTKIDKLFMWNRYASDYGSDGNNSNGCCIQFDPEMIDRIVSYSASDKTLTPIEDDYHLYRMVYVSDDGDITDQANLGIPDEVGTLYLTLKELAAELNEKMNSLATTIEAEKAKKGNNEIKDNEENEKTPLEREYMHLKDEIMSSLQQTLQSIMFLFKSDDYAEEDESRLIFVRTPDQQDSIRVLPKDSSNLSRLAINPFKQIYIQKIIFGPNVRNTEEWKPYLQYQLNKIWSKYAAESKHEKIIPNKKYSIENSKIHYRT